METAGFLHRLRYRLGLERNLLVLSAIIPAMETGEWIWMGFMPLYLRDLGANVAVISVYGMLKYMLPMLYPYPGGWLTDHLGQRRALMLFTLLAALGYAVFVVSFSYYFILAGMFLVMAWAGLALPVLFTVVADNLPLARRGLGFSVQSILQRSPSIWGPAVGAGLMALWPVYGIKIGMALNCFFALAGFLIVRAYFADTRRPVRRDPDSPWKIWREMDGGLKRLLIAESLARWAEEMPRAFVSLYICNVLHYSQASYSGLMAIRGSAELLIYFVLARMTDRLNRKPFVVLAFVFFGLFPFLLALSSSFLWLQLAFLAGGLSRIGEPARKALIVDLARYTARGRTVGLYYLIRGLAVGAAPLVGGVLWKLDHRLAFLVGGGFGLVSVLVYLIWGSTFRPSSQVPTHLPIPLPVVRAPDGSAVRRPSLGGTVIQPAD